MSGNGAGELLPLVNKSFNIWLTWCVGGPKGAR